MKANLKTLMLLAPLSLAACGNNPFTGHGYDRSEDYRVAHPIPVKEEPTRFISSLSPVPGAPTVFPTLRDAAEDYLRRGEGAFEVIGPAYAAKDVVRDALSMGIREQEIRFIAAGQPDIQVRYRHAVVTIPRCDDYSSDTDSILSNALNRNSSNFGCSTQRSLALMISNPEDLKHQRRDETAPVGVSSDRVVGRILDFNRYVTPPPPQQQQLSNSGSSGSGSGGGSGGGSSSGSGY